MSCTMFGSKVQIWEKNHLKKTIELLKLDLMFCPFCDEQCFTRCSGWLRDFNGVLNLLISITMMHQNCLKIAISSTNDEIVRDFVFTSLIVGPRLKLPKEHVENVLQVDRIDWKFIAFEV